MRRVVTLLAAVLLGLFGAISVQSPSLAAQNNKIRCYERI